MEGLLKGDQKIGLDVLAARGTIVKVIASRETARKSSAPTAKHLLEEVAESRAAKMKLRASGIAAASVSLLPGLALRRRGIAALLPVGPEFIVFRPLLRVSEHLVGFVDLLELLFRRLLVLGGIGVKLASKLAESTLDLVLSGGLGDPQCLVVVAKLNRHTSEGDLHETEEAPQSNALQANFFMLDLRLLREQPQAVKDRLATRGTCFSEHIDKLLAIDTERRSAETRLQTLQADRNRLSKEIGKLRSQGQDSSAIEAQVKAHAAEMQTLAQLSTELDSRQRDLLLVLPNLPQPEVPVGDSAEQNPVLRLWGEKPAIANPQDHVAIAERLKLIDQERATKISGSAFVCYTGVGARLERALLNFLLDLHTRDHGYTEISTPYVVKPEALVGTSQLPKFEEQLYRIDRDDLYLAPTAEVPVTNLHREETLQLASLPIKYTAYTPCFRREAGSAGLGTRGLIRMHQFDKVELVKICAPEKSREELDLLTADAERVLQLLGLHYRVIELCTGDIGFGAAKTYDIEVWSPGQNTYLEVSSCSNFEDFQARRMNLRFKGEDGKNRFCHTLNGSGTALARLYVALLENGLQLDGSVLLPEPLHDYFGGQRIS